MARIILHKKAAKYLQRMDARIKAQLLGRLDDLARDPGSATGVKPMEGDFEGCLRLRHGDLRVLYFWDQPADSVVVLNIGPRGDIYK